MEKKQYELCLEILRRFHKANILDSLILVGSWCAPFYKDYFHSNKGFTTLRTRDVDFLINTPNEIQEKVDIPLLLKDLGFVISVIAVSKVEDGVIIPGDGAAFYKSVFKLLVWRPELHELVFGTVFAILFQEYFFTCSNPIFILLSWSFLSAVMVLIACSI